MEEQGNIHFKKHKIKTGKKEYSIPKKFLLTEAHDKKDCTITLENNQITKIIIEGVEIPIDKDLEKKKEEESLKQKKRVEEKVQEQEKPETNTKNSTFGKIYKPSDTEFPSNIDNFALKLNKFAQEDGTNDDNKKFKFFKTNKNGIEFTHSFDTKILECIHKRQNNSVKQMNLTFEKLELTNDWRMAVGLGHESVYETSMTLHHVYGIPYIPASSVKGIVRSWIIQEEFDSKEKNEDKGALSDEGFCQLFGSPKKESALGEQKGSIVFFDSYPIQPPQLSIDIMNPHYGPYYSEGKPPGDYYDPIPIPFLVLEKASFSFRIGIHPAKNIQIQEGKFTGQTPLELAKERLEEALTGHGIGAKTAVGYGFF